MENHEEIYLEPLVNDEKGGYEGRGWCDTDVWREEDYGGASSTKYIRYDLHQKQIEMYIKLIESLTEGI